MSCTVRYCAVCLVITGMVRYDKIDPDAALAQTFESVGRGWMATIISAGAVAGLMTVVLTLLTGASRVVFAMSRDHLLPPRLSALHPSFKTPYRVIMIIGVIGILIAGFVPEDWLAEMVNIGTLTAFILVSIGVIVLRRTRPDLPRAFRVPGVPVLPIIAALICFYLAINLSIETWIRFLVWMVVGFLIYFGYSRTHSRLATGDAEHGPTIADRAERR